MGYPAFHKIDNPLDIPPKLEVVSIKLPDTCLGIWESYFCKV
jgi:hypothetical protein